MSMTSAPTRGTATEIPVAVYGNRWCGESQMARRALQRAAIPYAYVDLDDHPEARQKLQWLAGGLLHTPVIYVDGEWLMEPSMGELRSALMRHGAL
jgi:mycoredoxin